MSTPLIDLNQDLNKLRAEGYETSIVAGNLVVSGIPYVNNQKTIGFGVIFCPLTLSENKTMPPSDHTVYFMGDHPCDQYGKPDDSFVNSPTSQYLSPEITGTFYFSSKPASGNYPDFYSKMTRYINLLSAPAKSIDPGVSGQNKGSLFYNEDSVFLYTDTYTARANLTGVSEKLKNQRVAIVGLGGTGSYLLDFISKTPVQKISLFDGDDMLNHNAFRMPGVMTISELKEQPDKVVYFKEKYSAFRLGIDAYNFYLDESNVHLLEEHDFVFLSLDRASAKKCIIDFLIEKKIPFVDLGMGISMVNNSLRGTLRKTLITPENNSSITRIAMQEAADDDLYATNIQISELNALNAIQGVLAWKKLNGFYLAEENLANSTFILDEEEFSHET